MCQSAETVALRTTTEYTDFLFYHMEEDKLKAMQSDKASPREFEDVHWTVVP